MNIAHSTDRPSHEYQPTIIECRPLITRLAIQLAFFRDELRRSWPEFKKNPVACTKATMRVLLQGLRSSPNAIPATFGAIVAIACAVVMLMLIDKSPRGLSYVTIEEKPDIIFLPNPPYPRSESIGVDGAGRVGFSEGTGEGSGASITLAQGGGSGGNRTPIPPQWGKLPPPSNIQAAIPTAPPVH